jgi:hypothetical protein
LKKRDANGEIDKEELERRKNDLEPYMTIEKITADG